MPAPSPTEMGVVPAAISVPSTVKTPSTAALPAVREMQITMQELADAIGRDVSAKTMPKRPEKVAPGEAPPAVAGAKQAFNKFVVELHAGTLPPEEAHDVDEIMQTLQTLKSGTQTFKASGIWDTHNPQSLTTQALRHIVAFIGGLINLEEAGIAGKQTYYTKTQWQNLKEILDRLATEAITLSNKEKEALAASITTHLKGMLKLYTYYFRDQVLASPSFRQLVEGGAYFEAYDVPITDVEKQLIDEGASVSLKIPGVPRDQIMFPLRVLQDPSSFTSFLQRVGFEGEPAKALTSIKKQLGMTR